MVGLWSSAPRCQAVSLKAKTKKASDNIKEVIVAWLWAEDQKA
jgi:hypothetical protein